MTLDLIAADWRWVVGQLGPADELEASARASGALVRRREVRDAGSLLRLCLGYGSGLSLREAAVWAGMNGIAMISDVAVLKRLAGAAEWLSLLAGRLVSRRLPQGEAGRCVRIVDGSMVRAPGGGLWRLHAAYDLYERRFTHIELTDRSGAEKLERAPVLAGEIRIADRCYARCEGIRDMVQKEADFVVRIGWKSLCLEETDGTPVNLAGLFAQGCDLIDKPIRIVNGRRKHLEPIPARLILVRKDGPAAAHSRRRAQRSSQRGCSAVQPITLKAADYLMLVTSLDETHYPAREVAEMYRMRWQIELAFKRLKSLLDFGQLPAKNPALARTWLLAKLLIALIIEDLNQEVLVSPPWAAA